MFVHFIGQGKMEMSQGKVRDKSGNFDILCEWQSCLMRPKGSLS